MKLFCRMLILVAGALHLPLLLPERGQVAQARYGVIALEILPFLQGLFLSGTRLFARHFCIGVVRRDAIRFFWFDIQTQQFHYLVVGFIEAAAFERRE